MSDAFSETKSSQEPSLPWRPSDALRRRLLAGTAGALIASALSAAASVCELVQEKTEGLTWSMGLELAAILPQMLVLAAFFDLAKEIGSTPLKRSSVGFFVSGWLLQILLLADDSIAPGPWFVVLVGVLVLGGTVLLVAHAFGAFDSPRYGHAPFLATLALLIVGRRLFGDRTRDVVLLIIGIGLLLATLAFVGWFAVSLIRLRGKLGGWATVLGVWLIAGLLFFLAGLAWLISLLSLPVDPAVPLENLAMPAYQVLLVGGFVATVITAILSALLFLSVRRGVFLPRSAPA